MSTFGDDLVQSLKEALTYAKSEGLVLVHAQLTPGELT